MPQLVFPGSPIAIGIEGGVWALAIQLFGFAANDQVFGAIVDPRVMAVTAALTFGGAKIFDKDVNERDPDNKKKRINLWKMSPLYVAGVTTGAYAGATYALNARATVGDLIALAAGVYIYNSYIYNMAVKEFPSEIETIESYENSVENEIDGYLKELYNAT